MQGQTFLQERLGKNILGSPAVILVRACFIAPPMQKLQLGRPPAGSQGAWMIGGITDWNYGTELLKQHTDSQWHRDGAATGAMAEQAERGKSVLELHGASAAKEAPKRNREGLLKLLRSIYFLIKS